MHCSAAGGAGPLRPQRDAELAQLALRRPAPGARSAGRSRRRSSGRRSRRGSSPRRAGAGRCGRGRRRCRRAAARRSAAPRAGSRSAPPPRRRSIPSASKTFVCISGVADPDRPAAQLLAVPDDVVGEGPRPSPGSAGSKSAAGAVNGWCSASHRSSSSSRSISGQSTIQSIGPRPRRCSSKRSARSSRSWASTQLTIGAASATTSSRSPSSAPKRSLSAASSSSERNFAVGERQPSPSRKAQTRPLAPSSCARSIRPSRTERGTSRFPALMPRTAPPDSIAPRKTLNSVSRRTSVRSTSSRPKRVSGRSLP